MRKPSENTFVVCAERKKLNTYERVHKADERFEIQEYRKAKNTSSNAQQGAASIASSYFVPAF